MQLTYTGSHTYDDIITVAQIKEHLRVTHSLEDDLITAIRVAAVNYIENLCNVKLCSFTAVGHMPAFRSTVIPVGPVTAITSVKYETDNAGTLATLAANNWHAATDVKPARIAFSDYSEPFEFALEPVKVNMTVGYAQGTIPGTLIHAIRLLCAHMYENRQDEVIGTVTSRLRLGIDSLVSGERIIINA